MGPYDPKRANPSPLAPRASAALAGVLEEEVDEELEVVLRDLLLVVLGHDAGRESLGGLGVGIDDRFLHHLGVLAGDHLVEVGPDGARALGGGEGVAGGGAGVCEDLAAGAPRGLRWVGAG